MRDLKGLVKTSYANPFYVSDACQTPLREFRDSDDKDDNSYATACLEILFSGQCKSATIVKTLTKTKVY